MRADEERALRHRPADDLPRALEDVLLGERRLQLSPDVDALDQRARLVPARLAGRERGVEVEVTVDERRGHEPPFGVDRPVSVGFGAFADRASSARRPRRARRAARPAGGRCGSRARPSSNRIPIGIIHICIRSGRVSRTVHTILYHTAVYQGPNPFTFGDLALDEAFTDREQEVAEVARRHENGQNVVLFAPRRYGKSSLVLRAAQEAVAARRSRRLLRPDADADEGALRGRAREDDPGGHRPAAERRSPSGRRPSSAGSGSGPTMEIDADNGASASASTRSGGGEAATSTTRSSACSSCRQHRADRERRVVARARRVPGGRRARPAASRT